MSEDVATSSPPPATGWAAHRAAFFVRVLGVVEVVLFAVIAGGLWMLSRLDAAQLEQRVTAGDFTPEQAAAIEQLAPQAMTMAIATFLFGIAPGIVYMATSAGVRRASRAATMTALMLAVVQLIAVGAWCVDMLIGAFAADNPVSVTVIILSAGTFVGLLGGVILWCGRSLGARKS